MQIKRNNDKLKKEVIEFYINNPNSINKETLFKFNITETTLYRWLKQYNIKPFKSKKIKKF